MEHRATMNPKDLEEAQEALSRLRRRTCKEMLSSPSEVEMAQTVEVEAELPADSS